MQYNSMKPRAIIETIACQASQAGAPPVLTDLIIRLAYVSGLNNEEACCLLLKPYSQGFISIHDANNILQHFPFLNKVAPTMDLVGYTTALIVAYLEIEVSYAKGSVMPRQVMANVMASHH
ncbi:hypothetical protein SJI19_00305 [Acerihabitans sp. TG2]|uniref:hypothetical protein n=1 Tax=Acerihabitans sp. TG2 TaxID=3096008 RepID=UPI002B2221DF|nr:hypothetical protein [Acerihabitans sp. TG2]MEA9389010.1 hypothetical protein [Acerihabitans sp. TG2]